MKSSCFSLRNPWIIMYFSIPIFTLVCGDFTVFIIASLILCSSAFMFLTRSTHNAVRFLEDEEPHHCKDDTFDQVSSDQNDDSTQVLSNYVVTKGCLNVGSPDSCCESEIIDPISCRTQQDFNFDGCQDSHEAYTRPECSDGSISDEENLIEIELPGGHYVGYQNYKDKELPKFCGRRKSSDSVLRWPEMEEEENMIEIDILMGSIKCSRYEIKG
ncbi:hypothetical protein R6Q59_015920 [Mikania micrantha]